MRCRGFVGRIICATVLLLGGGPVAYALEVCGLQTASFDTIFANDFDVPGSSSGLGASLGSVSPPALGVTPTITITFPTSGAALAGGLTQVAGTVTGPVNTGVTVNGTRAYAVNGTFLTPPIQLEDIQTSIEAQATTMDGLTATASVPITVGAGSPSTTLSSDAPVGFAALPVKFQIRTTTTQAVTGVSVDFGDGSPVFAGSSAGYLPKHSYDSPGTFTATATVIFASGPPEMASARVIAISFPTERSAVCSVYAHLRSQLSVAQPTTAGMALMGELNTRLQPFYQAVGAARLPALAAAMGTIANGTFGLDTADIVTVREVGGQLKGYPLHVARDRNGVWRIDSM